MRLTPFKKTDDLFTAERVRFVSMATIACALAVLAGFYLTDDRGRSAFGPGLGADYAAFYTAGRLMSSGRAEELYEPELQDRMYRTLFPHAPPDMTLVMPIAPFLVPLFAPLSLLPYQWSFTCWLLLTASCYSWGFRGLWRTLGGISGVNYTTAYLAALSFFPFVLETWVGGQTAAIGFLCLSRAFALLQQQRRWRAGLWLSVCLYKPTWLLLPLLLLLVRGRWRALSGVASGALVWGGVSLVAVGWTGCLAYLGFLQRFGELKATHPQAFISWKYVDLRSSLPDFFHQHSAGRFAVGLLAVALVALLVRTWRRLGADAFSELWAWALAVTWLPVLSPHCGIYDSIVVVLGGLLAGKVWVEGRGRQPAGFPTLLAFSYLSACVSQPLARLCGVQVYSWTLFAFGLYQLFVAEQITGARVRPDGAHGVPGAQ